MEKPVSTMAAMTCVADATCGFTMHDAMTATVQTTLIRAGGVDQTRGEVSEVDVETEVEGRTNAGLSRA